MEVDEVAKNGNLKGTTIKMIRAVYEIMKARNGGVAQISFDELLKKLKAYVKEYGSFEGIQKGVGGKSYEEYGTEPKGPGFNSIADDLHKKYPKWIIIVDGVRYY